MTDTTTQLPRPASGEHLSRLANDAPGAVPAGPFLSLKQDTAWVPVGFYPALDDDGDSRDVTVSAWRMPAKFYRIVSERPGIDLSTGSGMHDLAHEIAEAICGGMLNITTDGTGYERQVDHLDGDPRNNDPANLHVRGTA